MTSKREPPLTNNTTEQAKRWLLLHASGGSDQQRQEFDRWCKQSKANYREYQRLEKLWRELDLVADDMVAQYANGPNNGANNPFMRWQVWGAMAASLIIALSLALMSPYSLLQPNEYCGLSPQTFSSDIGQVKKLMLADGTAVDLGPKSSVVVNYDAKQRSVSLNHGEAFFDVAKDVSRPFIVNVANVNVIAIGTQFNIYLSSHGAKVTVHEGKVNVTTDNEQAEHSVVELTVGDSISYSKEQGFMPVMSEELSLNTAWRDGILVFDSRPLKDVVADLNRYHIKTITIADHRLDNIEVNGLFKVGNSDAVLRAIESSLPARVVHYNNSIQLYYKSNLQNEDNLQKIIQHIKIKSND